MVEAIVAAFSKEAKHCGFDRQGSPPGERTSSG
jgi:hypothetical protein